jgi:hypothetical protein
VNEGTCAMHASGVRSIPEQTDMHFMPHRSMCLGEVRKLSFRTSTLEGGDEMENSKAMT